MFLYPQNLKENRMQVGAKYNRWLKKKHPDRSSVKYVSYYSNQVRIIIGVGKKDSKNAIIYREMVKNPNLSDNDLILHIQKILPKKFQRAESDIRSKISHMRHTKRRMESLELHVWNGS